MNYQQLGDAESANKAINVELQASKAHRLKAWRSNESYYRKKYRGRKRFNAFVGWSSFTLLDFIWGNGESALKLLRAALLIFAVMALVDVFAFRDPGRVGSYLNALEEAPQIFLGSVSPSHYWHWYGAVILFTRLTMFGFFMSIIIKRFNRR